MGSWTCTCAWDGAPHDMVVSFDDCSSEGAVRERDAPDVALWSAGARTIAMPPALMATAGQPLVPLWRCPPPPPLFAQPSWAPPVPLPSGPAQAPLLAPVRPEVIGAVGARPLPTLLASRAASRYEDPKEAQKRASAAPANLQALCDPSPAPLFTRRPSPPGEACEPALAPPNLETTTSAPFAQDDMNYVTLALVLIDDDWLG